MSVLVSQSDNRLYFVWEMTQEMPRSFAERVAKDASENEDIRQLLDKAKTLPLEKVHVERRMKFCSVVQMVRGLSVIAWQIKKTFGATVVEIYESLKNALPLLTENMSEAKREWYNRVFSEKKTTVLCYLRKFLREIERESSRSVSEPETKATVVSESVLASEPVAAVKAPVAKPAESRVERAPVAERAGVSEKLSEWRERYPHLEMVLNQYPKLKADWEAGRLDLEDPKMQELLANKLVYYVGAHPFVEKHIERYPELPEMLLSHPEWIVLLEDGRLNLQSPEVQEALRVERERQQEILRKRRLQSEYQY